MYKNVIILNNNQRNNIKNINKKECVYRKRGCIKTISVC